MKRSERRAVILHLPFHFTSVPFTHPSLNSSPDKIVNEEQKNK